MNDDSVGVSSVKYLGGMAGFVGRAVRVRLILIVPAVLAVLLVVFLVDRMRPVVYAATGSVQLGRVDGAELMSLEASSLHMNSKSFRRRVLKGMNLTGRDGRAGELIFDSLNARPQTTGTLLLVVRAPTEEQGRQALETAVSQLNEDQKRIRAPFLSELNSQLAVVDANIDSLRKIREALANPGSLSSETSADAASVALRRVWLLDLLAKNEERLTAAMRERLALGTRLGLTKTYPAMLDDDAIVTQYSPRPARNAMFAGAIVLLVLLLYAMVRPPASVRTS